MYIVRYVGGMVIGVLWGRVEKDGRREGEGRLGGRIEGGQGGRETSFHSSPQAPLSP